MHRTGIRIAIVALAAAAVTGFILAQDTGRPAAQSSNRASDEAAIRDLAQDLARSFEKGDAKAIAAFWTEEGEYIDEDGNTLRGRAELEKAYTTFFSKRPELKSEAKTDKVRFLGKDTAIEEGAFTVKAKDAPTDSSRYSTLYVRQDGRWQIALLKEWSDEMATVIKLDDLAFLIGAWESESDDVKARTTYSWGDDKKSIKCEFSVALKKGDAKPSTGTQIIRFDPAMNTIRAWIFDGEGGHGESVWTFEDDQWVIDSAGTLPDGSETTAMNFLKRTGSDGFTWRSVKRTVDGESLPDVPAVKVKRVSSSN